MTYVAYKLIHFLGIFIMIMALVAAAMHVSRGGTRKDNPHRRSLAVAHGVAALLVLTAGFGMLARMGAMHGALPGWVYAKAAIWFVLSAAMVVPYLGKGYARALMLTVPVLAVAAAAIALYKPF
jgi:hypothetical protein